MSDELPDRLSSIIADIAQSIAETEASIVQGAGQLEQLLESVETERSRVHSELEQIQLERLVMETESGEQTDHESDRESGLHQEEEALTRSFARVSSLQQQVADFGNLLTAARKQFGETEVLPGVEDAQELSVRQAMIRAKEDERRRLSREIHDGPAQVLANAIIGLEFIERALRQSESTSESPAVGEVERIKGSMRDGLSEIRRFIFDLRPSMLAQRGLVGTVEHYVNAYRTFLPDEIELELPSTSPNLNAEQELTAFRVIQESLQNIHRHADSTKCWISIETDGDATLVTVRDDGRGFQPKTVQVHAGGGSGIIGMRERAEVIGARLSVESSPGSGSEVRLEIPAASQRNRDAVRSAGERRRTS